MAIMNLSQLKQRAVTGAEFEIVAHRRSDFIGQMRKITKSSTSGIYTVVPGQPDHIVSRENGGKGYYIKWGRASNWEFANSVCSLFYNGKPHTKEHLIMSFHLRGDTL